MVGRAAGAYLYSAVRGDDPGVFTAEPKSRSVSNEVTFREDTRDRDVILRVLLELSHHVMFRLMKEGLTSKTVSLKVRFEDFTTTTVQKTMRHYLNSAEEIYAVACELLEKRWKGSRRLRLIGVGASSVEKLSRERQGELFPDEYDKRKRVEQTVMELKRRFPKPPVIKANLLHRRQRPDFDGDPGHDAEGGRERDPGSR
jgi:DNA polymerase-4